MISERAIVALERIATALEQGERRLARFEDGRWSMTDAERNAIERLLLDTYGRLDGPPVPPELVTLYEVAQASRA